MSARVADVNGWVEIKNNPISKVGVFQYSGRQISPELEPDTLYNVYRPEEELASEDCINSFKLVPWINDHVMLGGSNDGLTPADQKGIDGVIGENVHFESPYLKANLKVFSEKLAGLIDNGKKELSIGYRCVYELKKGEYNGAHYDAVQRNIRGNHVASVDEGRVGPDVAVLDHFKFTFDSTELKKMGIKTKDAATTCDEEVVVAENSMESKLDKLIELVSKLIQTEEAEEDSDMIKPPVTDEETPMVEDVEGSMTKKEVKDEEPLANKAMDAKFKSLTNELNKLKNHAMDTKEVLKEITQRDQLANQLSGLVGTFDHADKTLNEVAIYGIKKLGLQAVKGQEHAVLSGYLAGYRSHKVSNSFIGFDHSATKSNEPSILDFLNEGAA